MRNGAQVGLGPIHSGADLAVPVPKAPSGAQRSGGVPEQGRGDG